MCVFRRPLALQPSKIDVIEERERASVLRRLRSTAERQLGATVLRAMSKRSRVALELDSKETVHGATPAKHSIERPSEGSSGQVFGKGSEVLSFAWRGQRNAVPPAPTLRPLRRHLEFESVVVALASREDAVPSHSIA